MEEQVKITIYAAIGLHNQIGLDGAIPFESDLKRFKYLTLGKTLIMGRKTYESIGKVLPGRETIVITNKKGFMPEHVFLVSDVEQSIDLASFLQQDIAIVGGEQIYRAFIEVADRMCLTFCNYSGLADTYFPEWDKEEWACSYEESDEHATFKMFDRQFKE